VAAEVAGSTTGIVVIEVGVQPETRPVAVVLVAELAERHATQTAGGLVLEDGVVFLVAGAAALKAEEPVVSWILDADHLSFLLAKKKETSQKSSAQSKVELKKKKIKDKWLPNY